MENVISICGYKGSGKTSLILEVAKFLKVQGYKVAVVKSSHVEEVLTDKPHSDTWKYREAGVEAVLFLQKELFTLYLSPREVDVAYILEGLFWNFDLVLCEGLKGFEPIPKLWMLKDSQELEEVLPKLRNLLGIVAKSKEEIEELKKKYNWLEFFHVEEMDRIVKFVKEKAKLEEDRVKLFVNKRRIGLKPFIKEFLKVPFLEMVKLLKNVPEDLREIEFKIKIISKNLLDKKAK